MRLQASRSTSRISAARPVVAGLVGCATAALIVNTWIVEGLFAPLVVRGGSMAPALLGEHRQWHCQACDSAFVCDLESLPAGGASALCPHCGAANDPAHGIDLPGNRLMIDRSAFLWRTPKRWETVALRSPEDSETLCIKRVVGLPGELIEIADGDVFVNGAIARKDLGVHREMAVEVSGAADRWRGASATAWQFVGGAFVHDGRDGDAIDWLTYHHAEHAICEPASSAGTILNDSTYDQNESRQLDAVNDVILCVEVQASGQGTLQLHATSRNDDFRIELRLATGRVTLEHNGHSVHEASIDAQPLAEPTEVDLAVVDHRVQLALAGRTVLEHDYEPRANSSKPATQVLAVGASHARLEVRNPRVFRDVFYTPAHRPAQYRLGPGEYFVLGDNSPHSRDSRVWSAQGDVFAGLLLGPAITW